MSDKDNRDLTQHGATSPAPQNVGEGFKKAKHEQTAAEAPEGFVPNIKFFLENFGHMMSRVVLTVLYAVLITPVGIVYRYVADPFLSKYRGTSFTAWNSENSTLDQARRQG